jgi:hypothetical protein
MILNTEFLKLYFHQGYYWFRILGYGLHIANRNKCSPIYSTRKDKTFLGYSIRLLKP